MSMSKEIITDFASIDKKLPISVVMYEFILQRKSYQLSIGRKCL